MSRVGVGSETSRKGFAKTPACGTFGRMTPLALVVGFLGSGKTTFLKSLVPNLAERGLRPGLLINDYQNARVDAEQFRDLIDEVRALSGDCVCCGSRDQLFDELRRFQHGPRRVMLVETNGTTDAGPLIEALALDPDLAGFSPPIQVSMIDVQRWQKRFWHNSLERGQALTASHLWLTRADSVPAPRLAEVEKSLADRGIQGRRTDPVAFADELVSLEKSLATETRTIGCSCGHDHHGHEHHEHEAHDHEHAHHHHAEHHFASAELALPEAVDEPSFRRFLRDLPHEVVRAKGLVRFHQRGAEFFVFQKIDDDIQFFPVGPTPRVASPLLLVIGPRLDPDDLRLRVAALAPVVA